MAGLGVVVVIIIIRGCSLQVHQSMRMCMMMRVRVVVAGIVVIGREVGATGLASGCGIILSVVGGVRIRVHVQRVKSDRSSRGEGERVHLGGCVRVVVAGGVGFHQRQTRSPRYQRHDRRCGDCAGCLIAVRGSPIRAASFVTTEFGASVLEPHLQINY